VEDYSADETAVLAEVLDFEDSGEIISDGCARTIASWWHSPSVHDSAITALSHTGAVQDGILENIDRNTHALNVTKLNVRSLQALRAYCEERIQAEDTGQRHGWSNRWVR
jgi:hypothetical protein